MLFLCINSWHLGGCFLHFSCFTLFLHFYTFLYLLASCIFSLFCSFCTNSWHRRVISFLYFLYFLHFLVLTTGAGDFFVFFLLLRKMPKRSRKCFFLKILKMLIKRLGQKLLRICAKIYDFLSNVHFIMSQ